MSIKSELMELKEQFGELMKVESVHQWALDHKDSALYASLEWDNDKAGLLYRFTQIRRLIAIHVVSVEGRRDFISLTVDRTTPGGGYRSLHDVMSNETLKSVALRDALAELERIKSQYRYLKQLSSIWDEIDKASAEHKKEKMASNAHELHP